MGGGVNGRFRKTVFWLHLITGLAAGIVILIMSFTGVMLAFEKEITAWAERGDRLIATPTADAKPLSLDLLLARLREHKPEARPSAITLERQQNIAVQLSFGRTNSAYLNPYTGDIRQPSNSGVRSFMQTMLTWHRFLGAGEQRRALGKAITGACNAAFLFLAVSGLYLWWPRQRTRNALQAVALINLKLRGKARDWNWHNVVGFWCAPVLIVLTITALPISYRWANDLVYKVTRTTPPPQGSGPGASSLLVEISTPPPGAKPLGLDALFAIAKNEFPQWKQITYRAGGTGGTSRSAASTTEPGRKAQSKGDRPPAPGSPQPVTLSIVEENSWPLFATTQLTLDPFTGKILRKEGYSAFNLGRKVRSWTRFLHTGEALGPIGKLVAGAASAGALLLVYTGCALAWRRFFGRDKAESSSANGH